MASKNIKGITIKIGGETTELQKALKDVDKTVYSLNSDLKNLNQALKLDPKNTELLAQKQDVLKRNIEETTKKLNTLKEAQRQMGDYNKLTDEQKKSYNALSLEIAKSEKALNQMNKELSETNKVDLKGIKNSLNEIGTIAQKVGKVALDVAKKITQAFVGVATAIGGVIANGVKFNSEIEQLETSFTVMTGDADKARKVIEKLKKVGATTPYELKGLAKTTQTLMQYGLTADEAYEATLNLGDISQGSADKMQSIALAYGQMSSLGKVNMQDIKQMINAGFNPLQAIADMTGESLKQVNKRYEEGKISVSEITKAMKFASSEGGRYYQSMEKQSQTLNGQISTLKDNFDSLSGTLATGFSQTLTTNVLPAINELLQSLETAFTEGGITEFSKTLGDAVADGATKVAEAAPKFIELSFTIIDSLVKGIANNSDKIVSSASEVVSTFINQVLKQLPEIFELGLDLITKLADGLAENIDEIIPTLVETMINIFTKLSDSQNIDKMTNSAIKLVEGIGKGIINSIPKLTDDTETLITIIFNILSGGFLIIAKLGFSLVKNLAKNILDKLGDVKDAAKKLFNSIWDAIKQIPDKAKELGKALLEGLWNGINNKVDWVVKKIQGMGEAIKKAIKKVFGIASPSKVMRDEVGKNLALGIGEGFEDNIDSVEKGMINAIDVDGLVNDVNGAMKGLNAGIESSINPTINPNITYEANYKMMASAMKDALKDMVIELDDREVGTFVINTVSNEIYQ